MYPVLVLGVLVVYPVLVLGVNFPKYLRISPEASTLDVACTPVNPITSAGEILPTLEVDDTPVNGTPISVVIDPTLEVADTPAGTNLSLIHI